MLEIKIPDITAAHMSEVSLDGERLKGIRRIEVVLDASITNGYVKILKVLFKPKSKQEKDIGIIDIETNGDKIMTMNYLLPQDEEKLKERIEYEKL